MIAVCIASGSSLTQADVNYCRGKAKVYVVNDNYKLAPWADVLYAADTDWWEYHNGVPSFQGEKWTVSHEASKKYDLNRIDYKPKAVWSKDKSYIATGRNSGFQAINLAELQGATKIILLGYDMGFTDKKHWFGDHPPQINRGSKYEEWIELFNQAAPHITAEVINCTPNSRLTCFKSGVLRECL